MAHLEVDPADGALDATLTVRVAGLTPGARIEVEATTTDGAGRRWSATAHVTADEGGGGTVDGARLVSSMAPAGGSWPTGGPFQLSGTDAVVIGLRAIGDSATTLATGEARRFVSGPGVTSAEIDENAVRGTLFFPAGGGPGPAILDVGDGARPVKTRAALLASHGFVVLSLAAASENDATDDPPSQPQPQPLEPVEAAMRWLADHGGTSGPKSGVIGSGRGGELALLAATSWPAVVGAVVGWAASGVVLGRPAASDGTAASPWSYRGTPVPYLSSVDDLRDPDLRATATIPVERLDCPLLVVTGGADGVWPAHTLAGIARDRLAAHRHPHEVKHLRYIAAGHLLGLPNLPAGLADPDASKFGGRADADARASADSWPQVIDFLHRHLGSA